MNINAAFPSTFLKAADLQGRKVTITMDRVALEEVGGEHKPVLYFVGKDRGLVLNKTNGNIISELYGAETDDWHGKPIVIYPARVEFQGKIVDAIRVELQAGAAMASHPHAPPPAAARPATPRGTPVNGTAAAPQQQPAPFAQTRSLDDEIPF